MMISNSITDHQCVGGEPAPGQLSYQIVLNAYLREVENSWQCVETTTELPENINTFIPKPARLISIHLPVQGQEILVAVRYWSLTLRHQFAFPVLCRVTGQDEWQELELCHFLSLTMREEGLSNQRGSGELDTLMLRVLLSAQNTDTFIQERREQLPLLNDGRPLSFIDSEQSLVIGHQLHPVAKSREGFSSSDLLQYSPETAGRFQLCYFVADRELVHQDSALPQTAVELVKEQLGKELEDRETAVNIQSLLVDSSRALIPVHPWQAEYLRQQADVQALEESGQLAYLGPLGDSFAATTSIRTVFSEHCPFMYKFSLNVRITNSERVNKHWELDRVLETARMMQLPVAEEIKASAPAFEIVQEPAYLSLKVDGKVLDGFSCIFRDASSLTHPARDISAVTTLVQDNPLGGHGRLHNIIDRIAQREGREVHQVALDWFEKYVTVSIESLMKLFIDWGLCFEPHGQNTLIEMADGYPVRCFCRDGQGFFHREASHKDWCAIVPGKGEVTESVFPEELARERLIYYPFINQVFSVINALGTQGVADESVLMSRLRERMQALAAQPQRYPFSLLDVLDNSERLPCKGNLLTQLYNMDELVGDIATQSVYVTLPNIYKAEKSTGASL